MRGWWLMADWDDRPDIIKSALQWRQEQQKQLAPPPGSSNAVKKQAQGYVEPLPMEAANLLAEGDVPRRDFLDYAGILPMGNVILLSGDGGTGKSLLAMQLALACTTSSQWLNIDVQQGPVIYLSAEDDRKEVKIRMREICAAEGIDLSEAYNLHFIYMAGEDAVLAYEKDGQMRPSPLYHRLDQSMAVLSPMVVTLDNLADTFAGNENNRSLAKQFIGLLRRLAIKHDCVIVLLSHPSLSGLNSGSGTSGSTAWNNSVRSRLYLKRPDGLDAEDKDARVLEVMKANYGRVGDRYELKWKDGRFIRSTAPNPWSRVAIDDVDKVKVLFASGRYRFNEQSLEWGGNAVADLLDLDIGQGLPKDERTPAQQRLRQDVRTYLAGWVRSKAIYIVSGLGPDRKPTRYYSPTPPDEGE
jgi:archaellum biogenesis ATPase FlaH